MADKHDETDALDAAFVDDGGLHRHALLEEHLPHRSLLHRYLLREDSFLNDH